MNRSDVANAFKGWGSSVQEKGGIYWTNLVESLRSLHEYLSYDVTDHFFSRKGYCLLHSSVLHRGKRSAAKTNVS